MTNPSGALPRINGAPAATFDEACDLRRLSSSADLND
jgi:hypothetical protein